MLHYLIDIIWRILKKLVESLAVLLLGLIAAALIVLPWLFRTLALIGWIAGTSLMWNKVNNLYGVLTAPLPLLALLAVPAILSSALFVLLFSRRQPEKLWDTMPLCGLIGWLVWKGSALLQHWQYMTNSVGPVFT